MTDAMRAARSETEVAALDALLRLAAKGAYAAPLDLTLGADGPFGIFSPRDAATQPVAAVSSAAIAHASQRGWLTPGADACRYRIAGAGVAMVRRAKSAAPSTAKARAAAKSAGRTAPASTAPGRVAHEAPLTWLRRRKDKDGRPLITEPQFAAGERLAADFWHALMTPRVTADWSATPGRRMRRAAPGAGVDLKDNVVAARTRVQRALAAVGPELAGILIDVCCHDIGLEPAERAQGWPQRAAKVVLQLALTGLARHYGLLVPERPPGLHRPRHWGDEDYRPNLDAWRP